jgi:hypothetical protein
MVSARMPVMQSNLSLREENLDKLPEHVAWSFDAGYFGNANILFLSDQKVDGYIPDNNGKKEKNFYDKQNFRYNAMADEYICPENQKMIFIGKHFDVQKKRAVGVYKGQECLHCKKQRLET